MSNNNGKIIGALLVGAAAGAILGVLFAPEKGTDTRQKIADGAEGLTDDLKTRISAGKGLIDELISRVVSTGEQYVDKMKSETRYTGARGREVVNEL